MGAKLVSEVLMRWSSVPDNAFRALVRMAQTALDEPTANAPAATYFGGHDFLLTVLPARPGTSYDSRLRTAERTIADLVAMGAIQRVNKARSGVKQVYRLTLDSPVRPLEKKPDKRFAIDQTPVENLIDEEGQSDTQCRPQPDTENRAQPDTHCRHSPTPNVGPRKYEEGVQEKSKETPGVHGPVTLPRANPANKDGFIPPPQCGHPACTRGWVIPTNPNDPPHQCPQCNSNVIPFPGRKAQ